MLKLSELFSRRMEYDELSRKQIEEWAKLSEDIQKTEEFQNSKGWQLLQARIREELNIIIRELLTTDFDNLSQVAKKQGRAASLIQILKVADAKGKRELLEQEIKQCNL